MNPEPALRVDVWSHGLAHYLEASMSSGRIAGFRVVSVFAACVAAFAQSAPGKRVLVVVDSSGEPVNTACRTAPESPSKRGAREIDRNELNAIDMCVGYVDAQRTYFWSARRADGHFAFADKIRSAPGRRDGLYWPLEAGDEESPMGPKFARAAAAELHPADARPLFGYYFKILAAQGAEAEGGARNYRVDGRLVAGFALVAWPAEYGVTGVRVFQVNHRGEVYAKDLGSGTGRLAETMTAFAPDQTWTKVASAMD
jgi:hypothetical protein